MLNKLKKQSTTRTFTKHLTNISFILSRNELSLFYFLIYQSKNDNSIRIGRNTLFQFHKAYTLAKTHYSDINPIKPQKKIPKTHRNLKRVLDSLINNNLIIHLKQNKNHNSFLINPQYSYNPNVVLPAFYHDWINSPQNINEFLNHIKLRKAKGLTPSRYTKKRKPKKRKPKYDWNRIDFVRKLSDEKFKEFRAGIDSTNGVESPVNAVETG